MLCLSRKCLEKIHIGPDITVTVLEVRGRSVRLGIECPADIQVMRPEAKVKSSPLKRNETTDIAANAASTNS